MLGLGETPAEIDAVLHDLRQAGVDHLTLGQYLAPSPRHVPVVRYVNPEEFAQWGQKAAALGFAAIQSGPLVRSSYLAAEICVEQGK
jgi:lipoic acid synthetase